VCSNAIEMKEEQCIEVGKVRVWKKAKVKGKKI
jgi:hypothetical protein